MVKGSWIVLGVLAAIGLILLGAVGSAVGTYNDFVGETEAIDAQSKQVDVAYQRAFRLVPQLTNLAEQYMKNEKQVMENVTALRSGLSPAANGTFAAKDDYLATLSRFVILLGARAENYPDLKASQLFQTTMDEIVNSENKIAIEKLRYNDKVEKFNRHRRECCIPLLIAGFAGFNQKEYTGFTDRPNTSSFPAGQTL